jgi:hypothetical protein
VCKMANEATWTATMTGFLDRCQSGDCFAVHWDDASDDDIAALYVLTCANTGYACDYAHAANGNTYRPYAGMYNWEATNIVVVSSAAYDAMVAQPPAQAANHAAVVPARAAAPPGANELKNVLCRFATARFEQGEMVAAFSVVAGLMTGRPYMLHNTGQINGVAAASFMPCQPAPSDVWFRRPVDSSPLFPLFANDAFVQPVTIDDFMLIETSPPGELLSLAAHIGKMVGYAYSVAGQYLSMTGEAHARNARVSAATRANLGIVGSNVWHLSILDRTARACFGITFLLPWGTYQFGGMWYSFNSNYNQNNNARRRVQQFVAGREFLVTVLSQEVLVSAAALPILAPLPLVSDEAIAAPLVSRQPNNIMQLGFPNLEALYPSSMHAFEGECFLRSFVVGELVTAARPATRTGRLACMQCVSFHGLQLRILNSDARVSQEQTAHASFVTPI